MNYVDTLKDMRAEINRHIKKNVHTAYREGVNSLQEIFVYPNFDGSTICIELFTPRCGNVPAQCHMWHTGNTRKFLASPDWGRFKGIVMTKADQQLLLDTVKDIIAEIDALDS